MEIIKIKHELDMHKITINVIYSRCIIAEIIIICGQKPPNFYANRFLNQLLKYTNNWADFRHIVLNDLYRLARNNQIYDETPSGKRWIEKYNEFKKKLVDKGNKNTTANTNVTPIVKSTEKL